MPDLHFELLDACTGVNAIRLYYKPVIDESAIALAEFDAGSKVERIDAHYR